MSGYQGECLVCGWTGTLTTDHGDAEAETAEHAGHCWPEFGKEGQHYETVEGWCPQCLCFPQSCERTDSNNGHDPTHPGHET